MERPVSKRLKPPKLLELRAQPDAGKVIVARVACVAPPEVAREGAERLIESPVLGVHPRVQRSGKLDVVLLPARSLPAPLRFLAAAAGGQSRRELNRPATWKKTMEEMRYKEKAFAISHGRNCETAHNYAIVLMKSRKLNDAVIVLSNATALCGAWQPQLWHALSKVHELKGDAAAARRAAQIAEQIRRAEAEGRGRDEL